MADTTQPGTEPGATLNPPSRTILALDLGTTTGWALRAHDGLIPSGTVSFKPRRFDGGGMRYLRFTNWLTEIDRLSGSIEAIWFEEVRVSVLLKHFLGPIFCHLGSMRLRVRAFFS